MTGKEGAVADFGLGPPAGPPQSVLDIMHAADAADRLAGYHLAVGRGGTGLGFYTVGDILYASAPDVLTRLSI